MFLLAFIPVYVALLFFLGFRLGKEANHRPMWLGRLDVCVVVVKSSVRSQSCSVVRGGQFGFNEQATEAGESGVKENRRETSEAISNTVSSFISMAGSR